MPDSGNTTGAGKSATHTQLPLGCLSPAIDGLFATLDGLIADGAADMLTIQHAFGTYKTVKARFWPWLWGRSPYFSLKCSLFARKREIPDSGHTAESGESAALTRQGSIRPHMAHLRQSRPDYGLVVQVKALKLFPLG